MINKKALLLLAFNFVLISSFAEQNSIDSLLTVLKTTKEDTNKVNTLNALSKKLWKSGDFEQAKKYAENAFTISKKLNFKKGEAKAYNNIGVVNSYQGNYQESLKNLFEALKINKEIGDKEEIASSQNNIALIYFYTGDYQKALENHFASLKIFEETNNKQGIADAYTGIGGIYAYQGNYDEALKYHLDALQLRENSKDKQGEAVSYSNIGIVYHHLGNYPEALTNFYAFLEIEKELDNKEGLANAYNSIGSVYQAQGIYAEALKNFFASLKIYEELDVKYVIAGSYNNIGNVYWSQHNYAEALKNHLIGLKIRQEIGDKKGIADSYNNIGLIYSDKGNYNEALKNNFMSLELFEELGDKNGISGSLNNIANIYSQQAELLQSPDSVAYRKQLYDNALKNHFSSLKMKEEIGDQRGVAASHLNIGKIYLKLKKLDEAKKHLENALLLSTKLGSKEQIKDCYQFLSELNSMQGNWKAAFEQHKLFILYRDSLNNEETIKNTIQVSMTYEFEKKEALTKAAQDKIDALAATEIRKQQIIRYSVIGILILVIVFTLFLYNRFRLIRKQKNIIELKEKETQLQKEIIEVKHQEITDSINYAERIQRSFLATSEMLDRNLHDYFVFFKPKDIVSGDFYWAAELNNGNFAYSCADSTGHGVPGAIMSILNISSLEKSIEFETEPNKILNKTRKIIIERLKNDGSPEGGKDGMDCSLVVINKDKTQLSFAAANSPVFIVRNNELIEFKPDKMPVGKHIKDVELFNLQTTALQKGDAIYTLTDGFRDQFGGGKGKKYMIKKLKELLLQIAPLAMKEQEQKLNEEFYLWKGQNEQVDDVCIIGVRV